MGRKLVYQPGSWYVTCDRTGDAVRVEDTRKEWTGLRVKTEVWEPRHPQDLVRGRVDKQSVPDPRPMPPPIFVGPIATPLSAAANPGESTLLVEDTVGFSVGDNVGVFVEDGSVFRTTLLTVNPASVVLAAALPLPAASGNLLIDYR
jgi:hypothetical protein